MNYEKKWKKKRETNKWKEIEKTKEKEEEGRKLTNGGNKKRKERKNA